MAVQTHGQVLILSRGIYIIGTDTGVGKTAVAAGLMRLLLKNQCRAGYFKPVASGTTFVDNAAVSVDAAFVKVVSGFAGEPEHVTPFVYADAVRRTWPRVWPDTRLTIMLSGKALMCEDHTTVDCRGRRRRSGRSPER